MAISNLITQIIYVGNGSTTTFAIPFDFQLNAEIRVVLRDETNPSAITETLQVLTTDYTLTGGPPVTDVETVATLTSTQKLLVRRLSVKDQLSDLINSGELDVENVEDQLDHMALLIQEACAKVDRAAILAESTPTSGIVLPEPVADNVLSWNTAGDNLENKTASEIAAAAVAQWESTTAIIVNNQAGAVDVTGWTLDATSFSSATYLIEIDRPATTDLMSSGMVSLQRVEGAWRIDETINSTLDVDGGFPAGVDLSVTEAGGIAQVQYTSTNLAGGANGTIIFKRLAFDV